MIKDGETFFSKYNHSVVYNMYNFSRVVENEKEVETTQV